MLRTQIAAISNAFYWTWGYFNTLMKHVRFWKLNSSFKSLFYCTLWKSLSIWKTMYLLKSRQIQLKCIII